MAGNARWTSYSDVNKHPEDSLLLAYLRKQQLEDGLSIAQHIEVEKCPRCLHKLNKLKQVSTTLDALGVMQSYLLYPELSVTHTYAHMQRAANHRQQPRKSAVRLISLPAAFGLTLLFMVAMLVFANYSGKSSIPRPLQGGTNASQNNSTALQRQQVTPTPNLALTATANAGTNITPTATPVTGPYIEVCSTHYNIARWRLVICGHNFEAGYKVTLVAFGNVPVWLPNLPVDKQGDFKVGWNIVNCGNLPSIIVAHEVVNPKPISARLQNISFGSCLVRTPISRAN